MTKNKLSNIMRTCKREYFIKMLEYNKDNTKGIWNVINSTMRIDEEHSHNSVSAGLLLLLFTKEEM